MNAVENHPEPAPGVTPGPARSARGIGAADVALAADALLRDGLRPTIERIREKLGRGSPNTINPLLDEWWKGLARRLTGGPEMLERIPPEAFRILEALWIRLQIEARQRAGRELTPEREELARTARQVELKSEVLTLREGEYQEQIRRRERDLQQVEALLQEKAAALRAAENAASTARRQAHQLERELAEARGRVVELLARVVVRHREGRRATPKASPRSASQKRGSRARKVTPAPKRRGRQR